MTTRLRTLQAVLILLLVSAAAVVVYRWSTGPTAPVARHSADSEVCSHVSPAAYLWAPGGDWKTSAVAAVAEGASPLVRDAYFAAASAPFPDANNWSLTFPPYQRVMSQLASVCAGVEAKP